VANSELFAHGVPHQTRFSGNLPHQTHFLVKPAPPNALLWEARPRMPSSNGVRRRRVWPSRPSSMTHT
jgi:hypothetical protein